MTVTLIVQVEVNLLLIKTAQLVEKLTSKGAKITKELLLERLRQKPIKLTVKFQEKDQVKNKENA